MVLEECPNAYWYQIASMCSQEVSKTLLRMGDHPDGIGRLSMRGKTCEVKAAQPKDGGNRFGKNFRGDRREHYKIPSPHPHPYSGFNPPDAMGYPPPPGDPMAVQHYHFHPHGVPSYMPMYYPGVPNPPQSPAHFLHGVAPMNYHHHVPPTYMMGHGMENVASGVTMPPAPHGNPPQVFGFMPFVPAAHPPPQSSYTQTSVMQPVAPGIPSKEDGEE